MAYLVIRSDDNRGITDELRNISDTEGSSSILKISTNKIRLVPTIDDTLFDVVDVTGNSLFKIDSVTGKVIIGNDFVFDTVFWDDYPVPATAINPPGLVSDPTFDAVNMGYSFQENDQLQIIVQFSHKWKEGSAINPHVHYKQTTAEPANWSMDYRIYNNNSLVPETFNTLALDVVEFTYPGAGTFAQIQQPSSMLDMTGYRISSFIEIKLNRLADSAPVDVVLTEFDIHYQIDSAGSITEYIKQG